MNHSPNKSPIGVFPLSTSSLFKENGLPGSSDIQLKSKGEDSYEEMSRFSERTNSSSIANLKMGSEVDVDFAKENYNNSSPIRKSTIGVGNLNSGVYKSATSPLILEKNRIFEALKYTTPPDEISESFKNLRIPDSSKGMITKLTSNLLYLLSISKESKSLLTDSLVEFEQLDPSDLDQVHLLLNYFKLINKMNKVYQEMGLNQFKLELIINNCMDLLSKLNEDDSNFDSSF